MPQLSKFSFSDFFYANSNTRLFVWATDSFYAVKAGPTKSEFLVPSQENVLFQPVVAIAVVAPDEEHWRP